MINNEKIYSRKSAPAKTARMVESIVGCKWSVTVYQLLNDGINRPGQMVSSVEGLTTKVLNSCLKKNIEFGILQRNTFNEMPPRVEYEVTPFGTKFIVVLNQLEELQLQIDENEQ